MSAAVSQQFSLRWNNHTDNILQVFLEQYTSEWLVDVTFSCQGKFLKAHKMVVAACSPYFKELFAHHDTPHPIIILNGIKFEDLKAIIEFMYRGEVKVQDTDLDNLLALAETLQILGLCHIRKKYGRGDLDVPAQGSSRKLDQEAAEQVAEEPPECPPSPTVEDSVLRASHRAAVVRVRVNDFIHNDEELSSMIKVEPPDIRDIDAEPSEDWAAPQLVIDLPEIKPEPTTTSETSGVQKNVSPITLKPPTSDDLTSMESRIPRPPNAFMIFANEWRRKLAFQHPSENNKEISVRLGLMWKGLPAESKETYYAASRQADLDHKRKYPGYYYSPKEARLRKRLKRRNNSSAVELVRVLMNEDV